MAIFTMIYKNKCSPDDPSKYRCIGLLNHAYKVLSIIILTRLQRSCEGYLKDWQAGFRKGRGCRDNSTILRTLIHEFLLDGKRVAITFIDYSVSFDSVSHKFIDKALCESGTSNKLRAIFRTVYNSASAFTTIPVPNSKTVKSSTFPITRGVVQGDITSPLYFILALEALLRRHDNFNNKGVNMGRAHIHTLSYADDAALIDEGSNTGVTTASQRIRRSRLGRDEKLT